MQFTTIKGEQSVSALAGRIFGVGPRTAVAKRAAKALLAANPVLANIKELADGSPIAVPPIDDATPVEALVALGDLAATATIEGARAGIAPLSVLLDAIADDRLKDADEQIAAINEARARAPGVTQEPEIAQALDRATASAAETVTEVKELQVEQRSALIALYADLGELLDVLKDT